MNTGFKDQPQWFTGVVEDINDPSEMGRLKVRCFGYHTPVKEMDLGGMPTANLPWAHVMMPVNSASMTNIGLSATGILQGSWVIGFFRDGEALQDPFVIGTLPSMSSALPAITNGFADPDGNWPLLDQSTESPSKPIPTNDQPEQSRSEYTLAESYTTRDTLNKKALVDPSHVKQFPQIDTTAPVYPKNKVLRSESGHVIEIDDTTDKERLLHYHKSGTYHEVQAKGNNVTVVNGKDYKLIIDSENVRVLGDCNLVIDANCNTHIKGNYNVTVDKNYIVNVKGNYNETVKGSQSTQVTGSIDIDGARIDLN